MCRTDWQEGVTCSVVQHIRGKQLLTLLKLLPAIIASSERGLLLCFGWVFGAGCFIALLYGRGHAFDQKCSRIC